MAQLRSALAHSCRLQRSRKALRAAAKQRFMDKTDDAAMGDLQIRRLVAVAMALLRGAALAEDLEYDYVYLGRRH